MTTCSLSKTGEMGWGALKGLRLGCPTGTEAAPLEFKSCGGREFGGRSAWPFVITMGSGSTWPPSRPRVPSTTLDASPLRSPRSGPSLCPFRQAWLPSSSTWGPPPRSSSKLFSCACPVARYHETGTCASTSLTTSPRRWSPSRTCGCLRACTSCSAPPGTPIHLCRKVCRL